MQFTSTFLGLVAHERILIECFIECGHPQTTSPSIQSYPYMRGSARADLLCPQLFVGPKWKPFLNNKKEKGGRWRQRGRSWTQRGLTQLILLDLSHRLTNLRSQVTAVTPAPLGAGGLTIPQSEAMDMGVKSALREVQQNRCTIALAVGKPHLFGLV